MRPRPHFFEANMIPTISACLFLIGTLFVLCYENQTYAGGNELAMTYWVPPCLAFTCLASFIVEKLFETSYKARDYVGFGVAVGEALTYAFAFQSYFKGYSGGEVKDIAPRIAAAVFLLLLFAIELYLRVLRTGKASYYPLEEGISHRLLNGLVASTSCVLMALADLSVYLTNGNGIDAASVFVYLILGVNALPFLYVLYGFSSPKNLEEEKLCKTLLVLHLMAALVAFIGVFVVVAYRQASSIDYRLFYWQLFMDLGICFASGLAAAYDSYVYKKLTD
jgi:hypothetical protein